MKTRILDNVLMVWIFLMLIGTTIGMVLIIQGSNAPDDSFASDISGVFIELLPADSRNVFSLNEVAEYNLVFRDATGSNQQFEKVNIKVQYPREYLEPEAKFYNLEDSLFSLSEENINCTARDLNYSCLEFMVSKVAGSNLKDGDLIGRIFFKVLNNTREPSTISLGAESSFAFNKQIHSYAVSSDGNTEVGLVSSSILFKVQNKCLGDYNGVKDGEKEVDIQDLVKFGSKFGTQLNDQDMFNYDLITDTEPRLDELDLKIILANYNSNSCKFTRDNIPTVDELLSLENEI